MGHRCPGSEEEEQGFLCQWVEAEKRGVGLWSTGHLGPPRSGNERRME